MFNIEMRRASSKAIEGILVNLNDKMLRFNGKATVRLEKVAKDKNDVKTNLFDCFNQYVEGTFSTDKQIRLFGLYEKAHAISESGNFLYYETELAAILPIVNDIFDLIDIPKYCAFIQYSEFLVIPTDLSLSASKGDYPEQTTITDQDYIEQVKFLFVVRTIFPIVFSLLNRYESTLKGSAEYVCGALICDNLSITMMPGWNKLVTYVNFAFSKKGLPPQVDAVTSNEYFTDKVLYNIIYSRLCCAVVPETEENKNIATAINASVRLYETKNSQLHKKDFSEGDDEDKRSMMERYQVSEDVKGPAEQRQAEWFSFGLFDEHDNPRPKGWFDFQCISLGIEDPKLVEDVYERLPPNWFFEIHPHILKLLQLTFQFHVSPPIYMKCKYVQLMAAISLGQVYLAKKGYIYLPSLLGAIHNPDGVRSLADGLKLNAEDKTYLTSICDVQSRNNEGRSFNEAIVSATDFLDKLGNGTWHSNLEYGVLNDPDTYRRVPKGSLFELEIENEIKNEFMHLIRSNNS